MVKNFELKYGGRCDRYCQAIGKHCVGAWQADGDTCTAVATDLCGGSTESTEAGSASEGICQCSGDNFWSSPGDLGPGGIDYVGCFVDFTDNIRDLDANSELLMDEPSPAACQQHCKAGGYSYMGLQWANQCFCGNEYGRQGSKEPSECEACGRGPRGEEVCASRNAVYSLVGPQQCRRDYDANDADVDAKLQGLAGEDDGASSRRVILIQPALLSAENL
jgi:hypothetical protein